MKWKIYPEVNVETIIFGHYMEMKPYVKMWSKLRVYHLGKWYYQKFYKEFELDDPLKIAEITQAFHIDVYNTIHLGQVDLSFKDSNGEPFWELCEDQVDETERLKIINQHFGIKT